ncbi:MAG: GNAT family N-acetyltransferase [Planctomycetota bacterium]|jgi:putative acetyltransferase
MSEPEANLLIRPELAADFEAIHAVQTAAFETDAEARLVGALRERAEPYLSLVAEVDGAVRGHVAFSPVTVPSATLRGAPAPLLMGLAPLAVDSEVRCGGLGAELSRAGLRRCRELGAVGAVVLGDPRYYARFGFRDAAVWGLTSVYDVPAGAFQAVELQPGAFAELSGTLEYHPAFSELD